MSDMKGIVGGNLADDTAAFVSAWHDAERGEAVLDKVLAFESWEGLAIILTLEGVGLVVRACGVGVRV